MRRLTLERETLRALTETELDAARGGGPVLSGVECSNLPNSNCHCPPPSRAATTCWSATCGGAA